MPGTEWRLAGITVDPVAHPEDERLKHGCTILSRRLQGRTVLYSIGQYAGGYRIYAFDRPGDFLTHEVERIGGDDQWAWDVDARGDIWHGDAPGKTLRRYPFDGWSKDGRPTYDWKKPQSWRWPEGWQLIRRIVYEPSSDTLYLAGYLDGQPIETWGVVGASVRRYDGWLSGKRMSRWSLAAPRDGNPDPKEGPLTPEAMALAGDYLFFGMVKPTGGKQWIHIYRAADGAYAGSLSPGRAVADSDPGVGWLDMPYAVQAMKRRNGEYLVLAEEDWRGKNLLFRWRPAGLAVGAVPGK